jgi:hypothetical protein
MSTAANTAALATRKLGNAKDPGRVPGVLPGSARTATCMAAKAMTMQPPDPAAALTSGRRRAGAGGRAGRAAAGSPGMSAVSVARSA